MDSPPGIVLASGSPRRASVLRQLGIPFETTRTGIDETALPGEGPIELAERLAREKAVAGARPGALSLGFDTLVAHRGDVLGKPEDERAAIAMVLRLADDAHDVYTGIAAATVDRVESAVERTRVRFRAILPDEAAAYVATGEPLDKAGAYGIQGFGAVLVDSIRGDFFAVVGLPVSRLVALLSELGWRYDFRELVGTENR